MSKVDLKHELIFHDALYWLDKQIRQLQTMSQLLPQLLDTDRQTYSDTQTDRQTDRDKWADPIILYGAIIQSLPPSTKVKTCNNCNRFISQSLQKACAVYLIQSSTTQNGVNDSESTFLQNPSPDFLPELDSI